MATRRTIEERTFAKPAEPHPSKLPADTRADEGNARTEANSSARAHARFRPERDLTALALAAQSREPQALRAFLEATAPTVRAVCRSVLGMDHVELDDTIQECLIDILRALPQYRAQGPAVNYVKQITLHSAIATRKRGRNRERKLRIFAEEKSAHTFDVHAESLPSLRLVRDVIDELPAVQAEAILMRTILGFSLEEIALATNVSVNTAKSRLRVAKESLRRQLEQEVLAFEEREP